MNAKSLIRLGAFSEQKWVWAWVLKFNIFTDHPGVYKSWFGGHFGVDMSPKTALQSVCFLGFQLRDTIIEKNAPLPCESHVFACWQGLEMGRFSDSKSIKNHYFLNIHLVSDFRRCFVPKARFRESKTEANNILQKSISRRFAWNVKKCTAQAVFRAKQRPGPEVSPGGLGGLLSIVY